MSNKTEVKPEEPTTTPGAATSVEHIAPEDHYASGGQHQDQKKALKKSVDEGRRSRLRARTPGSTARAALPERPADRRRSPDGACRVTGFFS